MTSCLQVAVGVLLAEEKGNDEVVEMPYEALRKLRPTEILLLRQSQGCYLALSQEAAVFAHWAFARRHIHTGTP